MLLLCKEAIRRRPPSSSKDSTGSKPLSLEYLADRFDVDDPLFGYLVRTKEQLPQDADNKHWKPGMLQGFITVTTFTNYQKTFQWNSRDEVAYSFDDEDMAMERAQGLRKWDEDGTLAAQLEATI
jgi:hypothetical protein